MYWIHELIHNIKMYGVRSLFIRNLTIISCSILLPLAIVLSVIYTVSQNITAKETRSYNEASLAAFSSQIDQYLGYADTIIDYIFLQEDLLSLSNATDFSFSRKQLELRSQIMECINSYSQSIGFYDTVILLDNKQRTYYYSSGESGTYNFSSTFLNQRKVLSGEKKWLMHEAANGGSTLSYARTQKHNTVIIELQTTSLLAIAEKLLLPGSEICITTQDGEIILATANYLTYQDQASPSQYAFCTRSSPDSQVSYMLIQPLTSMKTNYDSLRNIIIILFCLSVIMVLLLSSLVTLRILRPITYLTSSIKSGSSYLYWQDFNQSEDVLDEIQFIVKNIELQNLPAQRQLKQKLTELKKAQAIALQEQIDSHFLFNSLDNINWEIILKLGGENTISPIINTLSSLLRLSLDNTRTIIPLKEEWEHAQLYIKMQRYRFENKFDIHYQLDPKLLTIPVLKLTLQPVLENIFRHAMPDSGHLNISVTGYRRNSFLYIEIYDDGKGMAEPELLLLQNKLQSVQSSKAKHIGLANVAQRLGILYNITDGVTVESRMHEYTKITLKYPIDAVSTIKESLQHETN